LAIERVARQVKIKEKVTANPYSYDIERQASRARLELRAEGG
jgi:hypothetical protein